jgi:hypothetical protein
MPKFGCSKPSAWNRTTPSAASARRCWIDSIVRGLAAARVAEGGVVLVSMNKD